MNDHVQPRAYKVGRDANNNKSDDTHFGNPRNHTSMPRFPSGVRQGQFRVLSFVRGQEAVGG